MEQLRLIPLLMFFVGILFIYAGFIDQSPTDILRGVLSGGNTPQADLYGPNVNPIYAGVTNAPANLTYQAPTPSLSVGTF
jgi:hypothetical protein